MSLDAEILKRLRDAGDGSVSGAELSQQMHVSRAAVWAHVRGLRALGYEIEASPHLGYRLLSSPDVLHGDDLAMRLGKGTVIGRSIQVFEETTSTNDVIEKLARDGVKEGAVVFAETQTRGRGRLGRAWVSPARKGLWFSILLRPALRPEEATCLTIASATALRRAISGETGLEAAIKWPNDICLARRKVAGILMEMRAEPDRVQYIILGLGVNVNLNASDFAPELRKTATSLKLEAGRAFSRAELALAILRELDADYARLRTQGFSEIADEWEKHCMTLGQEIVVSVGRRQVHGRAEALGEEGALLLRTEHGHLERIVGGDVTLRPST